MFHLCKMLPRNSLYISNEFKEASDNRLYLLFYLLLPFSFKPPFNSFTLSSTAWFFQNILKEKFRGFISAAKQYKTYYAIWEQHTKSETLITIHPFKEKLECVLRRFSSSSCLRDTNLLKYFTNALWLFVKTIKKERKKPSLEILFNTLLYFSYEFHKRLN